MYIYYMEELKLLFEYELKAKSYILIYGPLLSLPLVHAIRMWN